MMRTIYKYPLTSQDSQVDIQMPIGAEILHVDIQNGVPCLWVKVNPRGTPERRRFRIVATGEPFQDDRLKYLKTFQDPPYVWHVFEVLL